MKDEDFDRLLKTSRLRLSAEERVAIKRDIDEIIRYFDRISKTHAEGGPAHQPIAIPTRFREDVVSAFADIDSLKKTSKLHKGYILGPKL
ncbi:MAG: aspartyl/glutamyl-tRNA amidotransferase subunit C [Candidatus Marsarchaeota archaeon]|nr:aspartyl/glutamyl-tRNA amidotransferase subunit C [Candidatus Marsarchaeota archaeon]